MEFTRSPQVTRLYTGPGGALLYLLPPDATDCPPTIDFADSWSTYAGAYLFLEQPPADQQTFADAAWAFLADPRNQGARFAWLELLGASGLLSGTAIAVDGATTSGDVTFALRNVGLSIGRGATVAPGDDAFAFTGTTAVSAQWGGAAAGSVTSPVTLPFDGASAGCLQFELALSEADLDTLDVGLRWFYAIPPGDDFFLGSLRCPLFAAGVSLSAGLDPLAPLDPARTSLAFGTGTVSSHLRSTLGDVFTLGPQAGAALVFAVNPQASVSSNSDPLYLVPSGDFQLTSTRSGTVGLMCGLSGVEYLELDETSTLTFAPGHDSFAQGFIPGQPPGATSLVPTDPPTTSFATVTADSAGVTYFAQPDQSVLYNYPPGAQGQQTVTALSAVPVQAGTTSQTSLFPMLAYAGVAAGDTAALAQLESQVISPARKLAISASGVSALPLALVEPPPASKYSTTPQGLLATYVPGSQTWNQIILAQMPAAQPLMLQNVTGHLLSAFQSNKLFLVATQPDAFTSVIVSPNDQIAIGPDPPHAWFFDLDPSLWEKYRTILILKFADSSIEQLAGQTSTWAYATDFNGDPDATGKAILDAIATAKSSNDADFETFLDAMTNPQWNGIIALNVQAPLKELPAQLAGLAVGIDQSKFMAHHVGITASKIKVPDQPGDLGIEDSSIFGLIAYEGKPPAPGLGDYAFEVERLKVLFLNSAIASFSSVIDLEVNQLFGEPAKLMGSKDNIVRLNGVYQRHSAGGQDQDTFTFETPAAQSSTFEMTSKVLSAVVLSRGQFVTITADSTASRTDSEFLFWGLADFKALELDLFSFGTENAQDPPAGLSFGNLAIAMTFDPSATPVPTFAFDASELSLDIAASTARCDSLFEHFPLTLKGFAQGVLGASPTDLGYMGLQSTLTQTSLTFPWFALDFDLNLGSAGALAAEAGFVASLTAAWSPTTKDDADYAVFTGLKLPGSSGSKRQISIEGLFNITFRSLELIAVPPDTYVLVIYGIGFKFLSFTFPPNGQVNFSLFGDPMTSKGSSLGWYAAYAKDAAKPATKPELPSGNGGG